MPAVPYRIEKEVFAALYPTVFRWLPLGGPDGLSYFGLGRTAKP
jgi:hypothetical protein